MTYDTRREEVTKVEVVYENVRCDGCDKPLTYGFDPAATRWSHLDPDEGVSLRISGNYPSVWGDYHETFILCDSCVWSLWEKFPIIAKAMKAWQEPQNGEDE